MFNPKLKNLVLNKTGDKMKKQYLQIIINKLDLNPNLHYIKIALITIFLFFPISICSQTNSFVTVKGRKIINTNGENLLLKGINLGNWLVPEGYMFHFKSTNSPRMIYELFNMLIGEDAANKFWESYRSNYITKDDIHFIKSLYNFEFIRLFSLRTYVYTLVGGLRNSTIIANYFYSFFLT